MLDLDAIQARIDALATRRHQPWYAMAHYQIDVPALVAEVRRQRGIIQRALPWVTKFAFGEADSEGVSDASRREVEQLREDMIGRYLT